MMGLRDDVPPTGGVRFKLAVVAAARPGFARVRFADVDNMLSAWLPVVHPRTLHDKAVWTLEVGEHVACIMDALMEDGCIVGAVYSGRDAPPAHSAEVLRWQFADGASFSYDRASGAMDIVCMGPVQLRAQGTVQVQAPQVVLDTPQVVCSGNLTVKGALAFMGGMQGSGGGSGAATMQVQGDVQVQGNIVASGSVMDAGGNSNHHTH